MNFFFSFFFSLIRDRFNFNFYPRDRRKKGLIVERNTIDLGKGKGIEYTRLVPSYFEFFFVGALLSFGYSILHLLKRTPPFGTFFRQRFCTLSSGCQIEREKCSWWALRIFGNVEKGIRAQDSFITSPFSSRLIFKIFSGIWKDLEFMIYKYISCITLFKRILNI